ncbi:hypothetical protein D1BOALGB6SA_8482 [Olavius sp. associated proteobacterium Delta 1]|nr:hypothetical protein D1BOALGB6SA_8482 [Olavius sp. associated proteobacterium Delta 1]
MSLRSVFFKIDRSTLSFDLEAGLLDIPIAKARNIMEPIRAFAVNFTWGQVVGYG